MATDKQIEANRRNAQKSTGPRTEEGRAAVRFNSLTHGLTATSLCLPGDDPEALEAHLATYHADYRPTTQAEADLIFQMAMASWRLRRFRQVEAAFFAFELKDHKRYIDEYHPGLNEDGKIACILGHEDNIRATANLGRYLAQFERSFRTALQQLLRIRKQAEKQPAPAEVEEIKAPVTQIGFASQKHEEPLSKPEITEPAARKIGFAPPKKPAAVSPTENSQQPELALLRKKRLAAESPNTQYPIPNT